VIVGEHNAGKSNVIDALRTVLEPEGILGAGAGCTAMTSHTVGSAETRSRASRSSKSALEGLDVEEQARKVTCLAPKEGGKKQWQAHRW
jgi:hypothetical protein